MASDKSAAVTAHSRYETLTAHRRPYLMRAWDCAELTIPSLLPREGLNYTSELPIPWQSVGARCVNSLSSRLLLTMFPPNAPFFRFSLDEILVKKHEAEVGEQQSQNLKTDLEKALGLVERSIMKDVEAKGDRVVAFEGLKHLVVTGNVLFFYTKTGLRLFHLHNYVVRRDPSGNVLEIITVEKVAPDALPQEIRSVVNSYKSLKDSLAIPLYTHIVRRDGMMHYHQEACKQKIAGTQGSIPVEKCPWLPLRFVRIYGESYGRGYVEEYLGDFKSLEGLSKAIVEGAAAAAKVLFLVKPNGTTQLKTLQDSENGDVEYGNAEDVTVLQAEKTNDFKTAKEEKMDIAARLAYAFLLNSAIQRDAERVTAEEIRYMAQELESTLGGLYSILSIEFQLPYVKVKMFQMEREKRLPALPKGVVTPTIITGLEALGRGNDRTKLLMFLKAGSEALTPEVMAQRINVGEALKRLATADGIDADGLVYTDEQVNAASQQQNRQGLIEKVAPNLVNKLGDVVTEGIANGRRGTAAAKTK